MTNERPKYLEMYKKSGINIIPAQSKSKMPALQSWKEYQERQSTDEERNRWFGPDSHHHYNWICVCGKVSGNLIVVDFDKAENYFKFFEKAEELQKHTVVVRTNRGYHVYLRTKDPVKSFKIPELGIDIQGEGKYVIAPPSIHPDSGKAYELISTTDKIMEIPNFEEAFHSRIKELGVVRNQYVPDTTMNGNTSTVSIRRELPKIIQDLIAAGTKTQRNSMRWRIFTQAKKSGWPNEDILPLLLEYNRNSFEPWPDSKIKEHWENMCKDYLKYRDIYEKKQIKSFSPVVVSDEEITKMNIQPPKWLVEQLIPEKSVIVWGGKRGSFKTFCTLHIAACITNGLKVFGQYPTMQGNVLFLDEENGLHLLSPRLNSIKAALGVEQHQIKFCNYEGFKLADPDKAKALQEIILENNINLIIVDSMRRVMDGDENEADEINTFFMEGIRPLIEKFNLTVILLHHMRKGSSGASEPGDDMDELRGSSDIANFADMIYVSHRPKGSGTKFILKQVKNRFNVEIPAMLVDVEMTEKATNFVYKGEALEMLAEQVVAGQVIAWLAECNMMAFKRGDVHLLREKWKVSARTIDEALKVLLRQGKIRKTKPGCYVYDPEQATI